MPAGSRWPYSTSLPMCVCRESHDGEPSGDLRANPPASQARCKNISIPLQMLPNTQSNWMAVSKKLESNDVICHRKTYILGLCWYLVKKILRGWQEKDFVPKAKGSC